MVLKLSPTIHHIWSYTNVGSLLFTAAVYVGLLLNASSYTPAPCQSFIDALSGDSAAATDILMSNWFRVWELIFVLFQVGLLLGYFTLHGIMTFYDAPEEAHKFLVLSAEIFLGWLAFGFRVFGLQSTNLADSCTEVDVAPGAYWVIRASAMLFMPLVGVVTLQVLAHVAIWYMEHYKKGNEKVLKALKLVVKVFEIVTGAFGMAMAICYGIWAKNPWVKAMMWVVLSTILMNVYVKLQWIPRWNAELIEAHQQLQEEPDMMPQEAHRDFVQVSQGTATGPIDMAKDHVKYDGGDFEGEMSPDRMTGASSAQIKSAQLRNY